jgi:hypothetical protein
MRYVSNLALALGVVTGLGLAGCGSSTTSAGSSGGAQASGGASSGGATVASGGTIASGGVASSGGSVGSGGAPTSGGANSSGGTVGAGGIVTSGGATGTGGSTGSGGNSAAGGTQSAGGVAATGGSTSAGGVAATGGATGAGGVAATGGGTGTGGAAPTGGSSGTGGAVATGGSSGAVPACTWTSTPASCVFGTDQPCTKACGPGTLKGGQIESCQAAGTWKPGDCVFPAADYTKYKVSPTTAECPAGTTSSKSATACVGLGGTGTAPCTQACSTVDQVCAGYTDGSSSYYGPTSAKGVGFCICSGTTWSCANKTAWPCAPAGGPSSTSDVGVTGC